MKKERKRRKERERKRRKVRKKLKKKERKKEKKKKKERKKVSNGQVGLTEWKLTMNRNEDRIDKQKENFYPSSFWVSESIAAGFGALHCPNPFQ